MNDSRQSAEATEQPPLQFGVRTLLLAQAVCAVFCALLTVIGVLAVVVALLATVILASVRVSPKGAPLKRMIVDLMGGIVLPCFCLYYDPVLFGVGGPLVARSGFVVFPYFFLGFQMMALLVWLPAEPWVGRWGSVFAGSHFVGALIAVSLGTLLLPFSIIGVVLIIGVLGLVPFLTAFVFLRSGLTALRRARSHGKGAGVSGGITVGILLAVAIPLAAYWAFGEPMGRVIEAVPWPRPFPFD